MMLCLGGPGPVQLPMHNMHVSSGERKKVPLCIFRIRIQWLERNIRLPSHGSCSWHTGTTYILRCKSTPNHVLALLIQGFIVQVPDESFCFFLRRDKPLISSPWVSLFKLTYSPSWEVNSEAYIAFLCSGQGRKRVYLFWFWFPWRQDYRPWSGRAVKLAGWTNIRCTSWVESTEWIRWQRSRVCCGHLGHLQMCGGGGGHFNYCSSNSRGN